MRRAGAIVKTTSGALRGRRQDDVDVFRGVPYGALRARWAPAASVAPWDGVAPRPRRRPARRPDRRRAGGRELPFTDDPDAGGGRRAAPGAGVDPRRGARRVWKMAACRSAGPAGRAP